jgi:hypothetical protein
MENASIRAVRVTMDHGCAVESDDERVESAVAPASACCVLAERRVMDPSRHSSHHSIAVLLDSCLLSRSSSPVTAQLPAANTVAPAPVGEEFTPAIMTRAPASMKKPIIFAPTPAAGAPDADAPLTGAVPANLKKSAISEHIYGGAVEFEKSRTPPGCRCRKQLPEKYRYDTQFKSEQQAPAPCACGAPVNATKPQDSLPPVVARLYPLRVNTTANATAPCPAPAAPVVAKIAPAYYPKRKGARALAKAGAAAAAPCAPAAPTTITPSFYPTRQERRAKRKARRAAKKAGKK